MREPTFLATAATLWNLDQSFKAGMARHRADVAAARQRQSAALARENAALDDEDRACELLAAAILIAAKRHAAAI